MKYFQIALISGAFILLSSCGAKPTPVSEENDDVIRSYKLIDAGRPQEAIDLLEPRLRANPKRFVLKTALASAYAARAGLRIPRFAPLVIEIVQTGTTVDPEVETKFMERLKSLRMNSAQESRMRNTLRDILGIADIVRRFDTLPDVTSGEVLDVKKAKALLQDIPVEERGAHLYRSVLGAVEIRYVLRQEFVPAHFGAKRDGNCEIALKPLARDWSSVVGLANDVISDLQVAIPGQVERIQEYAGELERLSRSLEESVEKLDYDPRTRWPCEF